MIDAIIRWSLRYRLLVLVGALALGVWGARETLRMPLDVFPSLTAPSVTVVVEAHGMAPEQVERSVTRPVENTLQGVPGVQRLRSTTQVGLALVHARFDWDTDVHRARQLVDERLQVVRGRLPPEIEPPVMAPISSLMGEVMFLAMTSENEAPMRLRTVADRDVRRRLQAVDGVSKVTVFGGETRQLQVVLRPERLAALDLAPGRVRDALAEADGAVSAGFHVHGGQEYLIRGTARATRTGEIAETLVVRREGRPIRVGDVARVRFDAAIRRGTGSYNAAPAVVLGIQKQPGTNTLELTERLDAALDELEGALPAGMRIHRHVFRQAEFIEMAVDNVAEALRDGALLVVGIVVLFLLSLRASLVTVLAIPLSLLVAVLVLDALGGSLNTMTLGGMAIAVGAVVDDAIIDVENVVRRLAERRQQPEDERRPVIRVVFEASREIRASILFATLIIAVVFLPLFALTGLQGRLLTPLAQAYVAALLGSLAVALTVTPALASFLLPGSASVKRAREPLTVRLLGRLYDPGIRRVVDRPWLLTALAALALAVALWGLFGAGQSFLPGFREGSLTATATTMPGTSLAHSDALGRRVERVLLEDPAVVATSRRTGRAERGEHGQGVYSSEIDVRIDRSSSGTSRSMDELMADIRADLATIQGANTTLGQPISHRINHMLSGTRAMIAVKVHGPDRHVLERLAGRVRAIAAGIEGTADVRTEQITDIPYLTIRVDREAAARHGLQPARITDAVEMAFRGHAIAELRRGRTSYDLVLRYGEEARSSLQAIRAFRLTTPSGARVPLEEVATVRRDRGPNRIRRDDASRRIAVTANVSGDAALGGVVERLERAVDERIDPPAGYRIELGGRWESAREASRTLLLTGLGTIAGIFVLLVMAFRSARDAGLVMVNLPFALIGGVAGVHLAGGTLSLASIIGFITLFGIATRNGILVVGRVHTLIGVEGLRDPREAVVRAARERLAPILMTAIASGLGVLPLALSYGEPGSAIQAPMALVILCGLVTSTLLNVLLVPALYLRFGLAARRPEAVGPGAAVL